MTIARRRFLAVLAAVGGTTLGKLGGASAQTAPPVRRFTFSKPVIDAHFHWYPPEFVTLLEKEGAANGVTNIERNANGELQCTVPGSHPYAPRATFRRDMTDVNLTLKAMDDRRVNLCTLTQTNPRVLWAPPAFGVKLAPARGWLLQGADRVVCGTDFPQGMGIMKPVEYVEAIPGITQHEADLILCDNPARLLRL